MHKIFAINHDINQSTNQCLHIVRIGPFSQIRIHIHVQLVPIYNNL